jgi:hypothetical protein
MPRIGTPSSYTAGSACGESTSYTEYGEPDSMTPVKYVSASRVKMLACTHPLVSTQVRRSSACTASTLHKRSARGTAV